MLLFQIPHEGLFCFLCLTIFFVHLYIFYILQEDNSDVREARSGKVCDTYCPPSLVSKGKWHWWILEEKMDIAWGLYLISSLGRERRTPSDGGPKCQGSFV